MKNLNYTPDFIRQYYENCAVTESKLDAYEMTEQQFAEQFQTEIKYKHLKPTRFSDYDSFKSTLAYYIRKHRGLIQ